jgi:hypothetical protein
LVRLFKKLEFTNAGIEELKANIKPIMYKANKVDFLKIIDSFCILL